MDRYNLTHVGLKKGTTYHKYDNLQDSLYLEPDYILDKDILIEPNYVLEFIKTYNPNRHETRSITYWAVFALDSNSYAVPFDDTEYIQLNSDSCCYDESDLFKNLFLDQNESSNFDRNMLLSVTVKEKHSKLVVKLNSDTLKKELLINNAINYTPTTSGKRGGKKVINSKGKTVYESSTKKK